MFKVDYNKLKTHDLTAVIRENYERSKPKLFTFIHRIYEDEIGYRENRYKIEDYNIMKKTREI